MGADEYVELAAFEVSGYLVALLGGAEAVEVVDIDGEILESFGEGVEVLEGEDGGGNEDGDLLGVADGLECGSDGDFGLAEADVAADKAVHWCWGFHIGLELVGGVLVHKGGFELVLEVGVGAEGEADGGFALGVELDEVAGDVLDLLFGFLLEELPGVAAEAVESGLAAFLADVAADFVESVDGDVEGVAAFVDEPDDLLLVSVVVDFFESGEASNAVVDMGDVVAGLEFEELLEGEGLAVLAEVADGVFVVSFEDFVVGVEEQVLVVVDEAVAELEVESCELEVGVGLVEDFVEAPLLLLAADADGELVAAVVVVVERLLE